jgi:hypothetical protein
MIDEYSDGGLVADEGAVPPLDVADRDGQADPAGLGRHPDQDRADVAVLGRVDVDVRAGHHRRAQTHPEVHALAAALGDELLHRADVRQPVGVGDLGVVQL